MKKNECAQEMILDLVMRLGCEVILRPTKMPHGMALDVTIRHKGMSENAIIDLDRIGFCAKDAERIVCEILLRAIVKLFRFPYDMIIEKHFGEEGEDNGRPQKMLL